MTPEEFGRELEAEHERRADPLAAAKGCAVALGCGLIFWAVVAALILIFVSGD